MKKYIIAKILIALFTLSAGVLRSQETVIVRKDTPPTVIYEEDDDYYPYPLWWGWDGGYRYRGGGHTEWHRGHGGFPSGGFHGGHGGRR